VISAFQTWLPRFTVIPRNRDRPAEPQQPPGPFVMDRVVLALQLGGRLTKPIERRRGVRLIEHVHQLDILGAGTGELIVPTPRANPSNAPGASSAMDGPLFL
jgi:hypothetical protein